jgi:mevalonate kinase
VKTFRANGKLLLSGEYTILDGSLSIALPTKRGQVLHYKEVDHDILHWRSLNIKGETWFEAHFKGDELTIVDSYDDRIAETLKEILLAAAGLSNTANRLKGEVTTALEFPTDWGLGSSSTLLCCVAQCFSIDPMQLHFKVSNGSGYDVACGMTDSAITYQLSDGLAQVNQIQWKPAFSASLFFVYLNTKQKSSSEVNKYQDRKSSIDLVVIVEEISALTRTMMNTTSLDVFNEAIVKHEEIMSAVLGYPTAKQLYFSDYKGAVKSLGAWGGDFILATGGTQDRVYFADKGFSVIHEFESLIL